MKSADQIRKERAVFEEIAPPGWSLQSFDEGVASYMVAIPQKPDTPKTGIVSGFVTLDGRNEVMVKFRRAIARYGHQPDQDRKELSSLYPDFDGYEKDVAAGSIGYDMKRDEDIRAVAYYNPDRNISCYGHIPRQFRCYWGTPDKRMGLLFHSDDLGVVLPYVLAMAAGPKSRR